MSLLQNENLRKAVEEILERASDSKTVDLTTKGEKNPSGRDQETTQVTIRRVA
jgi:hypothetical protein